MSMITNSDASNIESNVQDYITLPLIKWNPIVEMEKKPSLRGAILTSLMVATYFLPRWIDPQGCTEKRGITKRYVTITLPDNAIIAALMVIRQMPNVANLANLGTFAGMIFLTLNVSIVLEFARFGAASSLDWLDLKKAAEYFGPRDFYAKAKPDVKKP